MAQPLIFEGTWEEIARHADEIPAEQRFRLIPLPSDAETTPEADLNGAVVPNEGMLAALREIDKRQEGRRSISGEDTQRMLRQARAGGLYGLEPTE